MKPAPPSAPSEFIPSPARITHAEEHLEEIRALLKANRQVEADLLARLDLAERRAKSAMRAEIITRWVTPLRTLLAVDTLALERGEPGLSSDDVEERLEIETLLTILETHDYLPEALTLEDRISLHDLLHKYRPALLLEPEKIPIPRSGGDYELDHTPILHAVQSINGT